MVLWERLTNFCTKNNWIEKIGWENNSLSKTLSFTDLKISDRSWNGLSILFGLISFLVYSNVFFLFGSNDFLFSFILSVGTTLLFLKTPFLLKKRKAGGIEKEIPVALRALATRLSLNICFEESLFSLCSGYGKLSEEIKKIRFDVYNGYSIQKALNELNNRVDSRTTKRVVSQLIYCYESGDDGTILKKLSEELISFQHLMIKQYSGKLVVYSLVFIAFSAMFPALFQAFVIIGSSFMETVNEQQAFWVPVLVFPLIDSAVLLFIQYKKPVFL